MSNHLAAYAGIWIAQTNYSDQVVGTGHTGAEAFNLARRNHPKAKLRLSYVPDMSGKPLSLSPILAELAPILAELNFPIYLVGGAVRDAVIGVKSNDLDFVVPHRGIETAFRLGDFLRAPAYPLDKSRDVGRVVLKKSDTYLDVAAYRGETLEADLYDRDFAINAMALPALAQTTAEIIDPHGGLADIDNGEISAIHDGSLLNDPVRILRGIRMGLKFGYAIQSQTAELIAAAGQTIEQVSPERVRDELIKLLEIDPATGLRQLQQLNLLQPVLPSIADLQLIDQSPPHFETVFKHTVRVLDYLKSPLDHFPEVDHAKLNAHLERSLTGGIVGRQVLLLGGLYHDVGKASTRTVDEDGGIHFYGHAAAGAEIAEAQLKKARFSTEVIKEVAQIVDGHMRPLLFALQMAKGETVSTKARHRFWRKYGRSGIDICLLAMADHLATYHEMREESQAAWEQEYRLMSQTISDLLNHYWALEAPGIKQPPLLTGSDLMARLGIPAGPEIGRLLRLLEEAQVSGEVTSKEEALVYLEQARA